jgi:hypothetical protein
MEPTYTIRAQRYFPPDIHYLFSLFLKLLGRIYELDNLLCPRADVDALPAGGSVMGERLHEPMTRMGIKRVQQPTWHRFAAVSSEDSRKG